MFEPENDLERSLARAVRDPAGRPQFYRDLVRATLFFVPHGPPPEKDGAITLGRGTLLKITPVRVDGRTYLPVFSSVRRLGAAVRGDVGCIGINALEFMKLTRGAELLLNPGSGCGKVFTKEEIAAILDGSIWQPPQPYTVEKPSEVLLGPPARHPAALVDALSRLFADVPEVRCAYVAQFINPGNEWKPHTLIGLEVTGNWDGVVARAGQVAGSVEVPDPPVDFVRLPGGGVIEDYFRAECRPFFSRLPGGG
jgi:hypothetical protein